jgi:cell division protein FtsL
MKSKGQTLVFEQVLLFTIGVVILIISFALFLMYQNFYMTETTQDQITQVKEYVLSNIVTLCKNSDINSSIVLTVPETIGNSLYRVSLSNEGLNVSLEPSGSISDFSTIYGLNETFSFGGMVVSNAGKIVIYKREKSIIIQ